MADNTRLNLGTDGDTMRSVEKGAAKHQVVVLDLGGAGAEALATGAVPVTGPLTDTQLRASAVPVSGTFFQATQPVSFTWAGLTDTELRATAVPVSLTSTTISNFPATQPVSAASLPLPSGAATEATVAGLLTDTQLRASAVPVSGPLTDTQLRASAVPVSLASTTVTGSVAVTGPLTDTQLRATPIQADAAPAPLSSYNVAGVIAINTVLLTLDCAQHRSVSLQCVAMGTTGVVTPEWSNNNTDWQAATMFTAAGASATTFNAAGLWVLPVAARYLRLRLSTATTAGTTTLSAHRFETRAEPWLATQPVSGTVTANQGTMAALPAGTNAVGDVGIQYRATATGAASVANVLSPATPAVQTVKAAAGRLLSITLTNTNAAARFLKVWNTASGSITLGTTAALFEIGIPPNQTLTLNLDGGIGFSTAINVAVTAGQGLTNNGAVTLGDVTGVIAFA